MSDKVNALKSGGNIEIGIETLFRDRSETYLISNFMDINLISHINRSPYPRWNWQLNRGKGGEIN